MDFIERAFGVSPDGGSGSLELALMLALVLAMIGLVFYRRKGNADRTP